MGHAKKKAAELAAWLETLSAEERTAFAVARAAYERIIKAQAATGMCYRMAFFLTAYLTERHGIRVEPVVGYINDGTDDIMISHAWIELGGKKTDISLTMTEHPDAQPTGSLSQPWCFSRHRASSNKTELASTKDCLGPVVDGELAVNGVNVVDDRLSRTALCLRDLPEGRAVTQHAQDECLRLGERAWGCAAKRGSLGCVDGASIAT